jgi:hypothetical protein
MDLLKHSETKVNSNLLIRFCHHSSWRGIGRGDAMEAITKVKKLSDNTYCHMYPGNVTVNDGFWI